MHKRWLLALVPLALLAVALRAGTTARASVGGPAGDRLAELGLDADDLPVPTVLSSESNEFILQYGASVDVTELAAQWTTGMFNAGYEKREDDSPSESRYIFEYEKDSQPFVLVVSASTSGPFVAMTEGTAPAAHWAVASSGTPPSVLIGMW